MSFEVSLSPRAIKTYADITEQLRQRWGKKYVTRLEAKLEKCVNTLKATPYLYPIDNLNLDLRKCVLHANCSLFYQVSGNKVMIHYFWDNRQEPIY